MQSLMPTCNKTQTLRLPVVSELNSTYMISVFERKVVQMFGVSVCCKPQGTLNWIIYCFERIYRYPSTLCMRDV
jgi:hypothetical protein